MAQVNRLALRPRNTFTEPSSPPGRAETAFAIATVFLLSDITPLTWLRFTSLEISIGAVVSLSLYSVSFCLLVRRWPWSVGTATADVLLWLTSLVAIFSIAWSTWPEKTFPASVKLVGCSLLGIYFAQTFTLREQLSVVWKALGIAAGASLVLSLFYPDALHTDHHAPAWKGVYYHKNQLGRLMALSCLTSGLALLRGGRLGSTERWLAAATLGVSAYVLHESQCKAALVVLSAVLAPLLAYLALRAFWSHRRALTVVTLLLVLSGGFLVSQKEKMLSTLGRDATLTGRTPLWDSLMPIIGEKPWLGYGYKAFWGNPEGPSLALREKLGWSAGHAHNAFLDLMLDVGLVGTMLFLVGFAVALVGSIRLLGRCPRQGLWPLVFLSFLFLYSFVESDMLLTFNTFSILYVGTVLALQVGPPARPLRSDPAV